MNSVSDAVFVTDGGGAFKYVCGNVKNIFGRTAEEIEGYANINDFIGYALFDREGLIARGEIENIECEITDSTGNRRFLLANVKKADITGGAIILTFSDVTERKLAEDTLKAQAHRLAIAEKMTTVGKLVSGVVHEINNPNNFIMLNAPELREVWQCVSPVLDNYYKENGDFQTGGLPYSEMRETIPFLFTGLIEGAGRIKRIVNSLKDFVRRDDTDMTQDVDVNKVVASARTMLANQIKKSTRHFVVETEPDTPLIKGNFQRLEQVVINLILNSCQALRDKKSRIQVNTAYEKGTDFVVIEVIDEGSGIDPEVLPSITDPFFTTRRDSGGTGLGLSISSDIVSDHGGSISFDSSPGEGTRVTVRLPVGAAVLYSEVMETNA